MKLSILSALLVSSTVVLAVPALAPATGTLAKEFDAKAAQGLRLIRLGEHIEPTWMTEDEKLALIQTKTGFMDITDTYYIRQEIAVAAAKAPSSDVTARATYPAISHQTAVKAIIATLSIPNMQANLATLTALNNRYYKSSTGATATTTIYNKLVSIKGSATGVTVTQFVHSWGQNSVIVKFSGTGASTIFGCHLDSINQNSPTSGRAPGADDNGTGVVNLMEAFRALIAAGFKPTSPVEFHFNSAEEGGLLGSQAIAASYKKAGTAVKAYVNLDMTAYFKPGTKEILALVTDYVDPTLNTYLRTVIAAYCAIPAGDDYCGYACSDHASWYDLGFPTANPFESTTANSNPNIHTSGDTISVSGWSWTHSLEFVKLVVGTVYELGA